MIGDLRQAALLGTSRGAEIRDESGAEIEALLRALPDGDRERRFLLSAGAISVWRRAGYRPESAPAPECAPPERMPPPNAAVERLLRAILAPMQGRSALREALPYADYGVAGLSVEHHELLPEACELLCAAGYRLPHALLPEVLPARTDRLRAMLRPVLGERGRWLAAMNPDWKWVLESAEAPVKEAQVSADPTAVVGRIIELLANPPIPAQVRGRELHEIPWPWPTGGSGVFVQMVQRAATQLSDGTEPLDAWMYALGPGAKGIGHRYIDPILAALLSIQIADARLEQWERVIEVVVAKLRIRKQLGEELMK